MDKAVIVPRPTHQEGAHMRKTKIARIALLAVASLCILAVLALLLQPYIYSPGNISQSIGFNGQKLIYEPAYWPTESWRSSTPEEQGIDSSILAEGLLAIQKNNINIHSLLIIRNGNVVLDSYFYPYDGQTVHELASVTKSLMTTLIAIAADQGKLELNQSMLSFFPERTIANRDPLKERITITHLASMSSGLESMGLEHDEGTLQEMMASKDWIQFSLDRKMAREPGTIFVYDSPGMHILSAILQEATDKTALQFARENLFEPLGIQEVIWPADPQGFTRGWGDLYLYPRDAAKIGYLWLNKGEWEGKQIVSREWVENSVKPQFKTHVDDYYGYGWWITSENDQVDYSAVGRGGQYIKVIPYLDLVIVATGSGFDFDEIEPLIAPALVDPNKPLPANPDGVASLNATLITITQAPEPKPVPPLPETARTISGKTFVFEPNPLQLKTLRLDFNDSDEAGIEITFYDNQSSRSGGVGLDGVYRMSKGRNNLDAGYRGYWNDSQTFVTEVEEIANRDAFIVQLHFEGSEVVLLAKERTHESSMTFKGSVQKF
jgi:CubicO group peptidase (beta-lactamase class C family)